MVAGACCEVCDIRVPDRERFLLGSEPFERVAIASEDVACSISVTLSNGGGAGLAEAASIAFAFCFPSSIVSAGDRSGGGVCGDAPFVVDTTAP